MAEPSTTRATRRKAWRGIRPRLVGLLLIPTVAALGLGGLRISSALSASADATRTASIAAALPDSFRLALQLQVERDAGSSSKAAGKGGKSGSASESTIPAIVQQNTDAAIAAWRKRFAKIDSSRDKDLRQDLRTISSTLAGIDELRQNLSSLRTRLVAQTEYTNTLNLLLGLAGRLPDMGSDNSLYKQAMALGQVRTAAEALASQRTLVARALTEGEISQFDLTALATATQSWKDASGLFRDYTSRLAQIQFDRINAGSGDLAGSHAPMQAALESLVSTGNPKAMNMTVAEWSAESQAFLAHVAGVISTAAEDLASGVDDHRASAQHDAIVSAATVIIVLLFVLLATVIVARSIMRPLHRLRDAALDIAQHGLPERVRALEESDEADDLSVEPIPVGSRDEIAEVAEAFDAVHSEAVRLAGEQAQMRANVNRMFVNLSRRSQSLVERQLRLIDELESGEQDPEHLANLFRLDHLATRMRRNDESLMVLAGGDTGQGARGPVPVLDVLRAASSEVEQFARVEIESGETAKFRGSVAGDLVHLLAELIENATNFSPPDSTVVVRSTRTSPVSPLVIEVRDLGIGMSQLELEAANQKLRSAGGLDADVARMMGLVVASRLADRHGLSVELRTNSPRGVVARVEVPTSVLVEPETPAATPVDALDPGALLEPLTPSPSMPEQLRLPDEPLLPPAVPAAADALDEPYSPLDEPYTPLGEPAAHTGGIPALPKRLGNTVLPPLPSAADEPVVAEAPAPTAPAPTAPAAPAVSAPALDEAPAAPAEPAARMPEPAARPTVRPPENFTPPTTPIASEPPVKSWFTTTVPLRDPEDLLNTYLTGRAEGVDGAIKNPLGSITKRAQPVVDPFAKPQDPSKSDLFLPSQPVEEPAPAPISSSGLPTRVPRSNLPAGLADNSSFNAFGSSTPVPPTASAQPAEVVERASEPVRAQDQIQDQIQAQDQAQDQDQAQESARLEPAQPERFSGAASETVAEPAPAKPKGPILDPLIAELAADVLNAPSAAEALSKLDETEEQDDTSIFASLQSEWFTRRTPLEARRSQSEAGEAATRSSDWVSPGDEGWRRAAELAEPAAVEDDSALTAGGLPVRVPGRNLVPGSASPAPVIPAASAENVVPLPRLERRRTRGLTSFQQGVSRARTSDSPESEDHSEEIPVLSAYDASENRAHEEHQ